MRKFVFTSLILLAIMHLHAQEKVDIAIINKIKDEGKRNSKVMDIAFQLTDVHGPRLSASPGLLKASNWAKDELTKWGLTNAALEPWGEFGKGWQLEKTYVAMTAPYYKPLIAFPKAWTKGTNGLKKAEVIVVRAKDTIELNKYKGQLKNKIVLVYSGDTMRHSFSADARRYTDQDLERMANAPAPQAARSNAARTTTPPPPSPPTAAAVILSMPGRIRTMAQNEGALGVLSMNARGHEGTLFVQGGGSYGAKDPENPLDIMVALEDYMTICRLEEAGYPVTLELDVQSSFYSKDTKGYNVIAEIKGTDPTLKEEVVMLGAHLDSWQGATGATDNAAGCAVMMEAVRILKAIGVQPRRTIRIALWTGEEQGLLGSRGYVKNHFGDIATMQLQPAHEKFSSYFNIDNGTGKIRGVYLQGNEKVKEIFSQWLLPFHDMGAKTLTLSNTGGTDHISFDAIGLPGFQFIQDPIEYSTRTHHTNMDTYDHLIPADMQQMSVIVAAFVYNAAMRDEKLPRKELPAARGF